MGFHQGIFRSLKLVLIHLHPQLSFPVLPAGFWLALFPLQKYTLLVSKILPHSIFSLLIYSLSLPFPRILPGETWETRDFPYSYFTLSPPRKHCLNLYSSFPLFLPCEGKNPGLWVCQSSALPVSYILDSSVLVVKANGLHIAICTCSLGIILLVLKNSLT